MSKSKPKRYFTEEDTDEQNKYKQYADKRKEKKLKAALKTRNLEYFREEEDT